MSIVRYTKLEKNPLPALKVGRKGFLRIREDDLIEFAKRNDMDVIALKQ